MAIRYPYSTKFLILQSCPGYDGKLGMTDEAFWYLGTGGRVRIPKEGGGYTVDSVAAKSIGRSVEEVIERTFSVAYLGEISFDGERWYTFNPAAYIAHSPTYWEEVKAKSTEVVEKVVSSDVVTT